MGDGWKEGSVSIRVPCTRVKQKESDVSRLWCRTYCWLTRGIVFGLVLIGEEGREAWSWMGTPTGLEKGVTGA